MAYDYDKLCKKLTPGVWYAGTELEKAWKVDTKTRRARSVAMFTQGLLLRRGKTAMIQYKLAGTKAKKKEKDKPDTTLDELIKAATTVGSENAVMRKALEDAKAIITKALEVNK